MIQLKHIHKSFHSGELTEIPALNDLNLTIHNGDYIVVLGPNGSGKSTLLNIIAGSCRPDSGELLIDDHPVTALAEYERSPYIARLFQNPLTGTAPDLSILDNFRLASLRSKRKTLRTGTDKAFRQRVADSIRRLGMGLEHKLEQPMGKLSGGQRQALTLLMSTMDDCRILLMDEPSSALDPHSSAIVMELAETLIREKKLTALLVTHRIQDVFAYGTRLLFMQEGRISRDLSGSEKSGLQPEEVYGWFNTTLDSSRRLQ